MIGLGAAEVSGGGETAISEGAGSSAPLATPLGRLEAFGGGEVGGCGTIDVLTIGTVVVSIVIIWRGWVGGSKAKWTERWSKNPVNTTLEGSMDVIMEAEDTVLGRTLFDLRPTAEKVGEASSDGEDTPK